MQRVAISTLGCKTNQFESAAMSEQFSAAGYRIVPFSEQADIYVVNSCTVTARTDAETRKLIRRARRLNPEARIVATGCYAQVSPDELEKMPEVDYVFGNLEKQDIAGMISGGTSRVSAIADERKAGPLKLESFAEHTRAFLQAQNGCNSFCSYCIVPYARGRSRSVALEEVVTGVRSLAANGFQEVVLTGIHLGAYGLDLEPRTSLADLVQKICSAQLVPRLRIGSLEPNELDNRLLALIAGSDSICPHLHLPLQSGSDGVLQRMGRRYDAAYIHDLLARVHACLPDAFIGADVIAGFPGESDAEFAETVRLVSALPFSDLHVFPYSRRTGTKAARLPDQLPPETIKARAAELRSLAQQKKQAFLQRCMQSDLLVLVQEYDPDRKLCKGLSRNYCTVEFSGSADMVNREIKVSITGNGTRADLKGKAA